MSFRSFRKYFAASVMLASAVQMAPAALHGGAYIAHEIGSANDVKFLTLAGKDSHVQIVVDDADYPCVKKAANMFCSDLRGITGREDAATVGNKI